jgi:hypothetical protein
MMHAARHLLLVGAVVASIAAADAAGRGFAVGVLRRDGVLIPFATFDGKRWRNTWPPPQLELTVPINVASIPSRWWGPTGPLDTWQAWIGGAPRPLRVVQPDWVGIHCVRMIALKTDYRADAVIPPQEVQPYPKDALAVSPPQPVEPIEIVPIGTRSVLEVTTKLRDAFNQSERKTESQYGHPIARRSREGVEPTIEAIYAFGSAPRVYYVEAVRSYRELLRPTGDCTAVSIGTGWFIRDADGADVRPLLMTVDVLNCDRRGASFMLPLGAMRVGAKTFWLAQFSGWDHERYVVIDITPKNAVAVVSTWGGGC